jgi:L-rhamnose isomerase
MLQFSQELLIHASRGVHWDSDHIVTFDDQMREIAHEIVRNNALERVHIALDFFDASMNRIGAWVTGARAVLVALLYALLEPTEKLVEYEEEENYFTRLALLERLKTMHFGAMWDHYCLINNVPAGYDWVPEVFGYEKDVLKKR